MVRLGKSISVLLNAFEKKIFPLIGLDVGTDCNSRSVYTKMIESVASSMLDRLKVALNRDETPLSIIVDSSTGRKNRQLLRNIFTLTSFPDYGNIHVLSTLFNSTDLSFLMLILVSCLCPMLVLILLISILVWLDYRLEKQEYLVAEPNTMFWFFCKLFKRMPDFGNTSLNDSSDEEMSSDSDIDSYVEEEDFHWGESTSDFTDSGWDGDFDNDFL